MSFRRDNHFVPQSYLKRWADEDGKVWCYRTLVSHEKVPLWRPASPKGVAKRRNLYTSSIGEQETDRIEKWFDREFEAPGERAIQKATSGARLSRSDYRDLARFVGLQDVRTTARLLDHLNRADHQESFDSAIEEAVEELEELHRSNQWPPEEEKEEAGSSVFPGKIHLEPGEEYTLLRAEVLIGREHWLYHLVHQLKDLTDILVGHRWAIMLAPPEIEWLTSDDPVLKLNFNGYQEYDLKGGWGSSGTDILLPLSPKHLLMTQVGCHPSRKRDEVLPLGRALFIQRRIAEHADRMVFSSAPNGLVEQARPRVVSRERYEEEERAWQRWHEDQVVAEEEFFEDRKRE